jgi:uncharacterized protein YigE (DUF2233 family)
MRLFSTLLVISVVLGAIVVYLTRSGSTLILSPSPTPKLAHDPISFEYQGEAYAADYIAIEKKDRVALLPNFEQKFTSSQLKSDHQCVGLINGGFYTPESKPTGLFVSESKVLRNAVASNLANGFIVSSGDEIYIGSVPQTDTRWALQSGPLLYSKSQQHPLKLIRDEKARRIVAFKSSRGHVYFVVFYKADSQYGGPLLADLPKVLEEFAKKQNVSIVDAINLDGGSASAFLTSDASLTEISTIGSFFCVK